MLHALLYLLHDPHGCGECGCGKGVTLKQLLENKLVEHKQYIEKYAKQYNGVHKDNSLTLLDMPYTNLSRKVYTGVFNEIEELLKLKLEQFS